MPACCRTRSISRNSSVCRPTLIPALVSLRLVLDGQLDSLAVATDGKHRIVAPFPVTLKDGKAEIQGKPGLRYQVLLDGERVIDVESQGLDQLVTTVNVGISGLFAFKPITCATV